jgi:hypothetical protein
MKIITLPALLLLAACGVSDPSMFLTGTEEEALNSGGVFSCANPKKALVCHVPPGNPANAHTICVGKPAVAPHQKHHGDSLGACNGAPTSEGGGGDVDDVDDVDGGGGGGNPAEVDAGSLG